MARWSSMESRFINNVTIGHGCWEWQGAVNSVGYGKFYGEGRQQYAHRYAWTYFHGSVPAGLCVLHACDNRRCVRPSHLFLGTKRDNTHDMWRKGRQRGLPAEWAAKSGKAAAWLS